MKNLFDSEIDEDVKKSGDLFLKKTVSDMYYKNSVSGEALEFDWLDEIEKACPFIDNIIRRPKLTLIQDENTVKIEKSKKITVASVKDLSKHANYISKFEEKTNEVEPEKILDIRSEETFNIYENRFLYTLLDCLSRFLMKKEDLLNSFAINNEKKLEYIAKTKTNDENVSIELKIVSNEIPKPNDNNKYTEEFDKIRLRVKRVREYLTSWQRCDVIKALDKAHVAFINPPIKPTNIILKNPNFQVAVNLWSYLLAVETVEENDGTPDHESNGNDSLKGFLDHSFLVDYCIMDSVSKSKKMQKEKLTKYGVYIITQEIRRTLAFLMDNGVKITDEELLKLIAKEMKSERSNRLVGADDVKKKFKNAMDEYLERTQDIL